MVATLVIGIGAQNAQALTQAEATALITSLKLTPTQAAAIQALVVPSNSTSIVGTSGTINCPAGFICNPTTPPTSAGTPNAAGLRVSNLSVQLGAPITARNQILGYTTTYNFTVTNINSTDLYISKNPSIAISTSTVGSTDNPGVSASSSLSYVSTSPATSAGDTTTSYVIPAGSSRSFSYYGMLMSNSINGSRVFRITSINYGTNAQNPSTSHITDGLQSLVLVAQMSGNGNSNNGQPSVTARLSPSSPMERIVTTSVTQTTKNVVLAVFSLKSQGISSTANSLTFHLDPLTPYFSNFTIDDGVRTYAPTSLVSSGNNTITFGNLAIQLPQDAWKDITFRADVAPNVNVSKITPVFDAKYTAIAPVNQKVIYYLGESIKAMPISFMTTGLNISNTNVQGTTPITLGYHTIGYRSSFTFTLTNTSATDKYLSKNQTLSLLTSTVGSTDITGASASSSINYLSADPFTSAGDTSSSYVIHAGASRNFTAYITLYSGPYSGLRVFRITAINYGTDSLNLTTSSITSGLDNLVITQTMDGGGQTPTPTQPSVTVTSPNAGDVYSDGQQTNIKWNTTGFSASQKFDIFLSLNANPGTIGKPIATGVPNIGSYTWTVKTLQPFYDSESHRTIYPSGKYWITVVCSTSDTSCPDYNNKKWSDGGVFTIANSPTPSSSPYPSPSITPTQPLITVISPNGGGVYPIVNYNVSLPVKLTTPVTNKFGAYAIRVYLIPSSDTPYQGVGNDGIKGYSWGGVQLTNGGLYDGGSWSGYASPGKYKLRAYLIPYTAGPVFPSVTSAVSYDESDNYFTVGTSSIVPVPSIIPVPSVIPTSQPMTMTLSSSNPSTNLFYLKPVYDTSRYDPAYINITVSCPAGDKYNLPSYTTSANNYCNGSLTLPSYYFQNGIQFTNTSGANQNIVATAQAYGGSIVPVATASTYFTVVSTPVTSSTPRPSVSVSPYVYPTYSPVVTPYVYPTYSPTPYVYPSYSPTPYPTYSPAPTPAPSVSTTPRPSTSSSPSPSGSPRASADDSADNTASVLNMIAAYFQALGQ